jgi:hypothetical protein
MTGAKIVYVATLLGVGFRPRRPKFSRHIGDLRSAGWLGQRPATASWSLNRYAVHDESIRGIARPSAGVSVLCDWQTPG